MNENPPNYIINGSKGKQELFRNVCQNCGVIEYFFTKKEDFYCNKICKKDKERKDYDKLRTLNLQGNK